MVDFQITLDDRGLIAKLAAAGKRADIGSVADDLALILQADVDERFDSAPGTETGGAVYGGQTWDRVGEIYLEANPRRRGGQLLRDTGELMQSFQVGGAGNILEVSTNSVVFGSALPKARGLNRDRPLLFAHPELIENLTQVWQNRILDDLQF